MDNNNRMKILLSPLLVLCLLSLSSVANAGVYLGLDLVQFTAKRIGVASNLGDSANPRGVRLKVGGISREYLIGRKVLSPFHFGIEGELIFGVGHDNYNENPPLSTQVYINNIAGFFLIGKYDATKNISIFTKLGVSHVVLNVDAFSVGRRGRIREIGGFSHAFGSSYSIGKHGELNVVYSRYAKDNIKDVIKLSSFSLGYQFYF